MSIDEQALNIKNAIDQLATEIARRVCEAEGVPECGEHYRNVRVSAIGVLADWMLGDFKLKVDFLAVASSARTRHLGQLPAR